LLTERISLERSARSRRSPKPERAPKKSLVILKTEIRYKSRDKLGKNTKKEGLKRPTGRGTK